MTDERSRLYSLPLDEFTAERNATARRLRADGDRKAAEEVRKLRKPNRPAWAINQAVRADASAAKRLVEAGKRLEKAQRAALGGKGADELRRAMTEQGEAVDQMTEAAAQSLEPKDRRGPTLDRVRETLRAVAADDELQQEFVDGRLTRDREAVGFGGSAPETVAARPARRRRRKSDAPADTTQERDAAVTARRREAAREVKRAERALRTATRRVEASEARLGRAQQAFDQAKGSHDEAERERDERETELADARSVLDELTDV